MKKLKILCAFLLSVLVFLSVILAYLIINREGNSVEIFKYYEKASYREYDLNENHLKFIGRSAASEDEIILSASGSGVEFICKGDYAEITLAPENPYVSSSHRPRVAIYSDGNLVAMECISEEKTYRINTEYSGTVITLVKLSEAMYSSVKLTKAASYGMKDIEPTEEKKLKIEFIGDSITCGYGTDGGAYGSFSTQTENFTKTYAYLTAEKLDADYSAVCYSGYGVLTGYTENGKINDKVVMNEYEKACHLTGQEDLLWDFSKEINNVVVINLGTNDASYCSGSSYGKQLFTDAYVQMLRTVREKNPYAYILCILGDMNNSLYPSIENAVSQYSQQTADSRVEAFSVDFRMGENDIVIDGHPGPLSNLCAAEVLTEKIKSLSER
ncbi:MAG: GDSL family lipase [Clostridia bacterium]|nr:GDSL family lipase [Clostridia bacterium]